jgi:outer membrane lipoprotein-sorting protein
VILKKYRITVITISLVCVIFAGCITNNSTDGSEITTEIMEKQDGIKDISFTRLLTVYIGNQSKTTRSDIWIKMPDKAKMIENNNPSQKNIIITNGTTLLAYSPIENSAIRINHPSADVIPDSMKFRAFIQDLIQNNTVEYLGLDTVNNSTVHVLKLVPKKQHGSSRDYSILWLDPGTYMPLNVKIYSNEQRVMAIEYINYKINSGLSDDVFELALPENASIMES